MSLLSFRKKEEVGASDILIFAMHDSAAAAFAMPMFFASEGLAIRALADAVNGGNAQIAAHAEEFKLFRLGAYNPVSGIITPAGPELVVSAAQLKAK